MEGGKKAPEKVSIIHRDWTQGSIMRNLLLLSWPMVLMETLYVISQVVDMIWVGRLGPSAIAGMGIANIVIMVVMAMDLGIIVGVRAMIARCIGAGDLPGANHVAAQGIIISVIWAALIMIIGVALTDLIMALFGMEADVFRQGIAYMRIMFAGWIALDLMVMGLYMMQSSGDSVTPMAIEGVIRVVHVTLCPFLVLGLWVFPHMGVSGAAISNVVSQGLGTIIVLTMLFSGRTRLRITWRDFSIDLPIMWRILKIGIPALVMNVQRSFGNLLVTWLVAPFGTVAVAAHSLTVRVQMFIFLPGVGLGMGAGVLVGQNLGAQQPHRAERSGWLATVYVEAMMILCSVALLFWAEQVIGVFTSDPELVAMGSSFLRIAAYGFMVIGFMSVLQNCIAGAGDTVPNMIISIAQIWAVLLPLAFVLSRYTSLDVYGILWAMVASTAAGSLAYIWYFMTGRWKLKKV